MKTNDISSKAKSIRTLQFVVIVDFELLLATSGGVGDVELQRKIKKVRPKKTETERKQRKEVMDAKPSSWLSDASRGAAAATERE